MAGKASDLLPRLARLRKPGWRRLFTQSGKLCALVSSVAKQDIDRRETLYVSTNRQFFGHAHAAMQLDRLLTHVTTGLAYQCLGCGHRAAAFEHIVRVDLTCSK